MNSLTIPSSPNWFETSILACSPDNTIIYGSKNDLVVIENSKPDEANNVRIHSRAHSQKISSVGINRNWGQPNKFVVTASEDKIVKIWNIETMKKHSFHNEHLAHNRVIGATFAGDERVISVSEEGIIVVWNVAANETTVIKNLFESKVNVTCISTCPHATFLTAFGLKNGLVVVADLRRKGKLLYKLRGHEKSVVSLSWCPVPINIFPVNPSNHVGHKKEPVEGIKISENDILKTNLDAKEQASESFQTTEVTLNDVNGLERDDKTDVCTPDDPQQNGLHPLLKVYESGDEDFLKECQNLRDKISGTEDASRSNITPRVSPALLKPNLDVLEEESKSETVDTSASIPEKGSDGKVSSGEEVVEDLLDESLEGLSTKTEISLIFSSRDVSTDVEISDVATEEGLKKGLKDNAEVQSKSIKKEETENVENGSQNDLDVTKEKGVIKKEETSEEIIGKSEDALIDSKEPKSGDLESLICSTPKKDVDLSKTDDSDTLSGTETVEENNPDMVTSDREKSVQNICIEVENVDIEETDGNKNCDEVETMGIEAAKVEEQELSGKEVLVASSAKEGMKKHDGSSGIEMKENNSDMVTPNEGESVQNKDINTVNADIGETDRKKQCDQVGETIVSKAVNGKEDEFPRRVCFLPSFVKEGPSNEHVDVYGPVNDDTSNGKTTEENGVGGSNNKKTCNEVGRTIVGNAACVGDEESPRKEFLLASSAKEGNIYIWRAGTDGRMQTFVSIPNKSNIRRPKAPTEKLWITLCWVAPTILLSSSKTSELLQWTLPKPKDKSKLMTVVHKDHSSLLFSIAAPPVLYNEFNWLEKKYSNVWTVSQDRLLLNTSLSSEKANLACYPTLGGMVTCLELSPLDPNRLAIGTGDGFVRTWDLSLPHTKKIEMKSFYRRIQSKITALAWHPQNEMLVAFGTVEGRLGYVDTNSKSRTVIFPHYFKSHIYYMEWAPISKEKRYDRYYKYGLYVVSEGKLVYIDDNESSQVPVEIEKPDNTFIYSFAWKKDFSLMLATTKSGFIIIYSLDMKILCKHYFQERLQELFWHPNSADSSSKQANWFACTTSSKKVVVYDFVAVSSEDKGTTTIAEFEGLGDVINSVSWSPYNADQLVIASENGVAQILDVEKNEIISTFINTKFDGIMKAIYSPVNEDHVICAGKDCTLKIWKISENPPKEKQDILSTRKKLLKKIAAESTDLSPKAEPAPEETVKAKKLSKSVLLPKFYCKREIPQVVADMRKLMMWKENRQSVEENSGDCDEPDILNIFGTNEDMMKLISLNETVLKQKGKYNMHTILSMFTGDISTTIKEAIKEKRVDPWIISLAPMVSPKLWQTACETYARQLLEEQEADRLEIATYFLACHKVSEAIDCLCEASMFREALALAKCRLTENDAAISDIIEKWGKYSAQVGNFETAAQCCIFLGKYVEAASILFRRSDLEIMEFVVELAEKSGNEEMHKVVLQRYESFKRLAGDDKKEEKEEGLPTKAEAFLEETKNGIALRTVTESSESCPENLNGGTKVLSTDTESLCSASEYSCEEEGVAAECSTQKVSVDIISQSDKCAVDDTLEAI